MKKSKHKKKKKKKKLLCVCLDIAYFTEIEKLLLKVL